MGEFFGVFLGDESCEKLRAKWSVLTRKGRAFSLSSLPRHPSQLTKSQEETVYDQGWGARLKPTRLTRAEHKGGGNQFKARLFCSLSLFATRRRENPEEEPTRNKRGGNKPRVKRQKRKGVYVCERSLRLCLTQRGCISSTTDKL